jgi:hypothetical protein
MKLTERRFIADPEIGAVVGFIRCRPAFPIHISSVWKTANSRFVHSLTVCTVPNCGFATRPPGNTK